MGLGQRRHHVVPRRYLARFADARQLIATHFVNGDRPTRPLPIAEVGVRNGLYLASPDASGVRGRDLEGLFAQIDNRTLPILRHIVDRWPVVPHDRGAISEYLAAQLLRTPSWIRDNAADYERWSRNYRLQPDVPEDMAARIRARVTAPEPRFEASMRLRAVAGTLFAAMRWTLLRASSPDIATCDQPLACVPFDAQLPVTATLRCGLRGVEEVRLPLASNLLLILDWVDGADPRQPKAAKRDAIRISNATSIRLADEHWFHRPGRTPPHADPEGRLVTATLNRRYDSRQALDSERRTRALAVLDEKIHPDDPRNQIAMLLPAAPTQDANDSTKSASANGL